MRFLLLALGEGARRAVGDEGARRREAATADAVVLHEEAEVQGERSSGDGRFLLELEVRLCFCGWKYEVVSFMLWNSKGRNCWKTRDQKERSR